MTNKLDRSNLDKISSNKVPFGINLPLYRNFSSPSFLPPTQNRIATKLPILKMRTDQSLSLYGIHKNAHHLHIEHSPHHI